VADSGTAVLLSAEAPGWMGPRTIMVSSLNTSRLTRVLVVAAAVAVVAAAVVAAAAVDWAVAAVDGAVAAAAVDWAVAAAAVDWAVIVGVVAAVDGAVAAVDGAVAADGGAIVGGTGEGLVSLPGGTTISTATRGGTGGRPIPSTPTHSSQGIPGTVTGALTATTWIQMAPASSAPVAK